MAAVHVAVGLLLLLLLPVIITNAAGGHCGTCVECSSSNRINAHVTQLHITSSSRSMRRSLALAACFHIAAVAVLGIISGRGAALVVGGAAPG